MTAEQRLRLAYVVRAYNDAHQKPFPCAIDALNYEQIARDAMAPVTVDQHLDQLLLRVAERCRFLGDPTPIEPGPAWAARLALPDEARVTSVADALQRQGWLKCSTMTTGELTFTLTRTGWEQVGRLRKTTKSGNSAFVAMWFQASMDQIYDEGIRPALIATGYQPARVDREPHNNRIDDEIISLIRRSRLLVVDVTGERAGCYYEAGFAQGLGTPVIWTCNDSWKTRLPKFVEPTSEADPEIGEFRWVERMHFDTRQFPHLLWTDSEDLRKKLVDRVRALGLELPSERS